MMNRGMPLVRMRWACVSTEDEALWLPSVNMMTARRLSEDCMASSSGLARSVPAMA